MNLFSMSFFILKSFLISLKAFSSRFTSDSFIFNFWFHLIWNQQKFYSRSLFNSTNDTKLDCKLSHSFWFLNLNENFQDVLSRTVSQTLNFYVDGICKFVSYFDSSLYASLCTWRGGSGNNICMYTQLKRNANYRTEIVYKLKLSCNEKS